MYSFDVQANSFFDFAKNKENESVSTPQPAITNNAVQDTINGVSNESTKQNAANHNVATDENSVQNIQSTSSQHGEKSKSGASESKSDLKSEGKGRRRGVWKRVRVRPVDSFETAESQNIGKHIYNSVLNENIKEFGERNTKKILDASKNLNIPYEYSNDDIPTDLPHLFDESDSYDQSGDHVEVQTVLPVQMIETSTKSDEPSLTTMLDENRDDSDDDDNDSSDVTTEYSDEREQEATSTIDYNTSDMDDLTTTMMPFISAGYNVSEFNDASDEKSTEKPQGNFTAEKKSGKDGDDQVPQSSSIMDEVKQKLTELFSFEDDDVVVSTTERVFKINRNFKRPKTALPFYTSIDRNPLINDITNNEKTIANDKDQVKSSPASMKLEPVPVLKTTILRPLTEQKSSFHDDLMSSVIYATSTSTEISHETEICYRGRCVKTQKKP